MTATTAGDPISASHAAPSSFAPHCLQNTASATVTGLPHCEQKRARVAPDSAMEHKWRVAQPHVIALAQLTRAVNSLAAQVGSVLAREVAQRKTAILRNYRRV